MKRLLLVLITTSTSAAQAGRPAAALEQERVAAEAEVHDLERRARALDQQQSERRDRVRQRLRALYKLSSGGYLRLLAGADSTLELDTRHRALTRVLGRDLDELAAVGDEAASVDADQARRADELTRVVELANQLRQQSVEPPTGLEAGAGHLRRPVLGPVVGSFGPFRDPDHRAGAMATANPAPLLERSRRGVELRSHPGETVRTVAAGQVRWIGEVPGLGRGIAIDHADGYLSLTAHLGSTRRAVGELLAEGAPIGESAAATVYLELTQQGTAIDPAPWLER